MIARAGWTADDFAAFRRSRAAQDLFLRIFHAKGGRIAVGTDAANQMLIPGYAVHREMQLLVAAGLTPGEAISAATRNGAHAPPGGLAGADRAGEGGRPGRPGPGSPRRHPQHPRDRAGHEPRPHALTRQHPRPLVTSPMALSRLVVGWIAVVRVAAALGPGSDRRLGVARRPTASSAGPGCTWSKALLLTLLGALWFGSLGAGRWWLVFGLVGALREWPTAPATARPVAALLRVTRTVVAGGLLAWRLGPA